MALKVKTFHETARNLTELDVSLDFTKITFDKTLQHFKERNHIS